jgi:hypothetical protein
MAQQTLTPRHDRPVRISRRHRQAHNRRQRQLVGLAAASVVLVLVVLIAVRLLTSPQPAATDAQLTPELLASVTTIPPGIFDQVGRGTAVGLPAPVRADVRRGPGGLPLITYIGAEYCPFCAAERWSLIVALSRFGQFTGLTASRSASDDVFPNTPTFSFVGSSYTSQYLSFSAVELQSNVRAGRTYATLQTPTPDQEQLLTRFDAPPYVPESSAGAIPFIDIADQYVITGASYDLGVLRSQSLETIAQSLADPSSPRTQAIVGAANVITAALCAATGDAPAEVCARPSVQSLEAVLASSPAPAAR